MIYEATLLVFKTREEAEAAALAADGDALIAEIENPGYVVFVGDVASTLGDQLALTH